MHCDFSLNPVGLIAAGVVTYLIAGFFLYVAIMDAKKDKAERR